MIVISEIVCVKVPNFGFVVFDSEEAVEKALASRPIMLEGNHRWGTERYINNQYSRIGPWGILLVEWKKVVIGAGLWIRIRIRIQGSLDPYPDPNSQSGSGSRRAKNDPLT
jgi:hypothetical protein